MDSVNKKKLISDTYVKLLAEKPGDKITVTMLISECGLSRQTFYYHFRDILDVVEYTFRTRLGDILLQCNEKEDPKEGLRMFIEAVDESRGLIKKLESTSRRREIERCVSDAIAEIAESLIANRYDVRDRHNLAEMRFVLSMYAHGFEGYMLDKIEKNEPLDADALANLLYRFVMGEINMSTI